MTRLFVYGTLKRGAENNAHLEGQRFLGEAVTAPGYVLYGLFGYPGMVPAADATEGVTGELWEVDADCLSKLDRLEGLAEGLYTREAVPLQPPFADRPAQSYLYHRSLAGRPRVGSTWRV
jgi:gamma-glutamylaminecyclotransferase